MVSNPVVPGTRIFALPDVNANPGGSVSFNEVAARFIGEEFVISRLNVIGEPGATTGRSTDFVTSSEENVCSEEGQIPAQTLMDNAMLAVNCGLEVSFAVTVKADTVVGPAAVPLMTPVLAFKPSPAGSAPAVTVQEYGVVPPVAATGCE